MPRLAPRLLLALAACAGCSYDWDIAAPGVGDGGEAGADSGTKDGRVVDAPTEAPSPIDTGSGDSPQSLACMEELNGLASLKAQAVACSSMSDCMTSVTDECDCPVWVAKPLPDPTTLAYTAAVGALASMGSCKANCSMGCPPPLTQSACVGSGSSQACTQ
jgi:hypothetical protein